LFIYALFFVVIFQEKKYAEIKKKKMKEREERKENAESINKDITASVILFIDRDIFRLKCEIHCILLQITL
jgi:hypothetical protein